MLTYSKKLLRSGVAFALVLLLLLMHVGCASENAPAGTTNAITTAAPSPESSNTDTGETTAEPKAEFVLDKNATVICPTDTTEGGVWDAVSLLISAAKELAGITLRPTEDFYRGELVRKKVEILVGNTNRPESVAMYESLTYYDYAYEVISPGVVVICGGSDEATLLAMQKFLLDCYGYGAEGGGALCPLPVGTTYLYRYDYAERNVFIQGKPIDTFSIVHPTDKKAAKSAAEYLQKSLEMVSGKKLPVIPLTEYKGGDAIFVGCDGPSGEATSANLGNQNYVVRPRTEGDATYLCIEAKSSIGNAVEEFAEKFLVNLRPGDLDLSFKRPFYGLLTKNDLNGLVLQKTTKEVIADGVVFERRDYKDQNGKPVVAYVIRADLTKVTVRNATPGYGNSIVNQKATTKAAMQAMASLGFTVYAGVNADFFNISGDYSPTGLCIKEGKVLHESDTAPFFGLLKDGTPVIGTSTEYSKTYKGKLLEAVGGSQILLKNGMFHDLGYESDFGKTRHPRTAVGFNDDGELFLVVVDGRQPSTSNGASLSDLAVIFTELGATEALNLDGGGSSSCITSAQSDVYVTRNSPSDGWLRKVYNSLVIIKKTDEESTGN